MRAATGIFSLSVALVIGAANASAESWLATGDRLALDDAAQDGLEYGPIDEPVPWVNPDTGNGGTFTPTATYQDSGNVCREYTVAATIGGRDEQVWGIACRQPDGSWREASADPPTAQPATTAAPSYPATYPATYPAYPATYPAPGPGGWYWPPISVSANYCNAGYCVGGTFGYPTWFYPGFGINLNYSYYGGGYRGNYAGYRPYYRRGYRGYGYRGHGYRGYGHPGHGYRGYNRGHGGGHGNYRGRGHSQGNGRGHGGHRGGGGGRGRGNGRRG